MTLFKELLYLPKLVQWEAMVQAYSLALHPMCCTILPFINNWIDLVYSIWIGSIHFLILGIQNLRLDVEHKQSFDIELIMSVDRKQKSMLCSVSDWVGWLVRVSHVGYPHKLCSSTWHRGIRHAEDFFFLDSSDLDFGQKCKVPFSQFVSSLPSSIMY